MTVLVHLVFDAFIVTQFIIARFIIARFIIARFGVARFGVASHRRVIVFLFFVFRKRFVGGMRFVITGHRLGLGAGGAILVAFATSTPPATTFGAAGTLAVFGRGVGGQFALGLVRLALVQGRIFNDFAGFVRGSL